MRSFNPCDTDEPKDSKHETQTLSGSEGSIVSRASLIPASIGRKLSELVPQRLHACGWDVLIQILNHLKGVDVDLDLGRCFNPILVAHYLAAKAIELLRRIAFDQYLVAKFSAKLEQGRFCGSKDL